MALNAMHKKIVLLLGYAIGLAMTAFVSSCAGERVQDYAPLGIELPFPCEPNSLSDEQMESVQRFFDKYSFIYFYDSVKKSCHGFRAIPVSQAEQPYQTKCAEKHYPLIKLPEQYNIRLLHVNEWVTSPVSAEDAGECLFWRLTPWGSD